MKLHLLKEGDWAGIVTMAIGLSALRTVLEEGNKDDWFDRPSSCASPIVAAVFLTAFICHRTECSQATRAICACSRAAISPSACRQCARRLRALRHRLRPAAISRPGAALQCRADRQCAGMDRAAAAAADPVRAACS